MLKKRDFIILFAVGVFTVILGIWFIFSLVFQIIGASQPVYGRSGVAGAVFIFAGLALISQSYQIFIPIKKPMSETSVCPYCGAVLAEDSTYCEKCKNKLD